MSEQNIPDTGSDSGPDSPSDSGQDTPKVTVSRRGFIAGAAGLTFAVTIGYVATREDGSPVTLNENVEPNAWVTIAADDTITIMSPSCEMGQGSMTGVPVMLAEDLDADWSKVRIEQVNGNHKVYGNAFFGGLLYTGGSQSISNYYKPLRLAGAQARRLLMQSAASVWGVPESEVTTKPSLVVHTASGRTMTYGEAAAVAEIPEVMPEVTEADLKSPEDFRYIGKNVPRVDVPLKVNGSAQYAMDVHVPGMVHASVIRPPVEGETPISIDDTAALKVEGVIQIVTLPYAVAVIGKTVEATRFGREVLEITWSETARAQKFDTEKDAREYLEKAVDVGQRGTAWREQGNAYAAINAATRSYQREYICDNTYHAQMEPLNSLSIVNQAGDGVEIWAGTQSQTLLQFTAAKILGTSPDKIKLHEMLLGGGFGLRASADQNYVMDSVRLSRELKKPVKVIWTREDDIANGRFRPLAAQCMRAGFDKDGKLIAWNHRVAAASVLEYFNPVRWSQVGGKDVISMLGSELHHYDIPNIAAEHMIMDRRSRIAPWRGVAVGYTVFAIESFMDELAEAEGVDPLEFRLRLLKERAATVLKKVAQMADWGREREGTALGIAFGPYHSSIGAGIAEISVNQKTGKIRVHNFWSAVDPGLVVQPLNVETQVEGAIIYGLSHALIERITIEGGQVQQSNYHDYQVMRMKDVPEITISVMSTDNAPSGVGEIGLPMTGPAVANAFARLTGKRLRRLPMTPDRVLEVLKA